MTFIFAPVKGLPFRLVFTWSLNNLMLRWNIAVVAPFRFAKTFFPYKSQNNKINNNSTNLWYYVLPTTAMYFALLINKPYHNNLSTLNIKDNVIMQRGNFRFSNLYPIFDVFLIHESIETTWIKYRIWYKNVFMLCNRIWNSIDSIFKWLNAFHLFNKNLLVRKEKYIIKGMTLFL